MLLALRAAWRARAVPALALLVALVVNGLFEYPFWNVTLSTLVVLSLAVAFVPVPRPAPSDDAIT